MSRIGEHDLQSDSCLASGDVSYLVLLFFLDFFHQLERLGDIAEALTAGGAAQ